MHDIQNVQKIKINKKTLMSSSKRLEFIISILTVNGPFLSGSLWLRK